jgi:hypothetical protein
MWTNFIDSIRRKKTAGANPTNVELQRQRCKNLQRRQQPSPFLMQKYFLPL